LVVVRTLLWHAVSRSTDATTQPVLIMLLIIAIMVVNKKYDADRKKLLTMVVAVRRCSIFSKDRGFKKVFFQWIVCDVDS